MDAQVIPQPVFAGFGMMCGIFTFLPLEQRLALGFLSHFGARSLHLPTSPYWNLIA
jgi:hypothetical protein